MEKDKLITIENAPEVSADKFVFAENNDLGHDKKLQTKPISYFKGAFMRFCKNKGALVAAIVIAILVLFAIIVPFCTPYSVSYADKYYAGASPKNNLFKNTSFWDGCQEKTQNKFEFTLKYAIGLETNGKHNAIKNQEYKIIKDENGNELYNFRLDSIEKIGCVYRDLTISQYKAIQAYQDANNIQMIYPVVEIADRPNGGNGTYGTDANFYFKTVALDSDKIEIIYDENGDIIPVYSIRDLSDPSNTNSYKEDLYTSKMRIEGSEGLNGNSNLCYRYAVPTSAGVQVRVNYYEYYVYQHTELLKDGIESPYFLFGCDTLGKDILTCLSSGARFSFIFAIVVALVNMLVGAIYGAIAGYYGGKIDLVMERISEILSALPSMIVITLLKYHMGSSSHVIILFISFFITGWIGMAGTTRMQFYRFKNQEYVLAARTLGARDKRIMFKHIFPNAIGTLVTSCALIIPSMIYSETSLTYLGIVNLSTGNITSVGTIIANGQPVLTLYPHITMFPTVFLVLLMLSFNLFGNGLRDAFNPSLRGSEE